MRVAILNESLLIIVGSSRVIDHYLHGSLFIAYTT